jgi:hypothetical protein
MLSAVQRDVPTSAVADTSETVAEHEVPEIMSAQTPPVDV